jgi:hypothetical protein
MATSNTSNSVHVCSHQILEDIFSLFASGLALCSVCPIKFGRNGILELLSPDLKRQWTSVVVRIEPRYLVKKSTLAKQVWGSEFKTPIPLRQKKFIFGPDVVVHAYNPSYAEGAGRRAMQDPIWKITKHEAPEFKISVPQKSLGYPSEDTGPEG